MEASALQQRGLEGLRGPTPLLRLQSDERLVVLVRRGNQSAYEALVARYQSRLLAFCRHMLGSREDAEDVLQEVFAAAYNAMVADDRALNVRPWLYRIARNRSLNHLRRARAVGVDSMDHHLAEQGTTTADKVHKREEFRLLMSDVGDLPETQRTALLLREMDALSYEQIAEAMDTTVPSVKSLLVRARVSLAEAAESRLLTCEDVRDELGEVAEGLRQTSAPVRRHLRTCERCATFRKELRRTTRTLALALPVGPLLLLKKLVLANAGGGAAAAGASAGAGGAVSFGVSAVASKAVATVAAAAIVTAGAVEVEHVRKRAAEPRAAVAAVAPAPAAEPQVVAVVPQPAAEAAPRASDAPRPGRAADEPEAKKEEPAAEPPDPDEKPAATTPAAPVTTSQEAPVVVAAEPQQSASSATLPPMTGGSAGAPSPPPPSEPPPPAAEEPPSEPPPSEPPPSEPPPSEPPAEEPPPDEEPPPAGEPPAADPPSAEPPPGDSAPITP